jgi:hypothetical protein
MSGEAAGGPGVLVSFSAAVELDDPSEVALEDYARAVARAEEAEAVRGPGEPGPVTGVRLRGAAALPTPGMWTDIEDFARDLASRTGRTGLGWS